MKKYTGVLLLILASFLFAACGEQKEQSVKTETLYFQISGATWQVGWSGPAVTAIQEFPGVKEANLNSKTWQVAVIVEADKANVEGLISHFSKNTKFTLAQIEGFSKLKAPSIKGLDVVEVSKAGEDFDLKQSLAKGKLTIIEFSADWCMPCKVLEKKLVSYITENEGIALRKVNIVSFESEVAKTKLKGVGAIPYVIIIDSSGKEVYRGTGIFKKIVEVIAITRIP